MVLKVDAKGLDQFLGLKSSDFLFCLENGGNSFNGILICSCQAIQCSFAECINLQSLSSMRRAQKI